AIEKEFGFLPERLPQVVIEVPINSSVRSDGLDIAQPQPLSGEIRGEIERASIGEHPACLLLELSGLAQPAPNGGLEQLIVWAAAPKEKRQPGRQLEIADSVDPVCRHFPGVRFHAEQEVRVDENRTQRSFDSRFEIALGTTFAIEGHRLINVSFDDR